MVTQYLKKFIQILIITNSLGHCNCVSLPISVKSEPETYNPKLLENDMIFDSFTVTNKGDGGVIRNANRLHYWILRWPYNTVNYQLDKAYNATELAIIKGAMDEISNKTCIRFRDKFWNFNYVYINRNTEQCSSPVGRRGGRQNMNLGPTCMRQGIIVHELLHAIGYFHEHNRPDRDNYIEILWDNVKPEEKNSFSKDWSLVADTLGLEYDYKSIMHYPHNTFSVDGNSSTMIPKKGGLDQLMGSRNHLTELDALKINRMYRCD